MRLTRGSRRICGAATRPTTTPTTTPCQVILLNMVAPSGLVALNGGNRAADGQEVDDLVQRGADRPVARQLDRVAHGGVQQAVEQRRAGQVGEVLVEPQVVDALVKRRLTA